MDDLNQSDVSDEMEFCESCVLGKILCFSFPTCGGKRVKAPLELVHSDVCGKVNLK